MKDKQFIRLSDSSIKNVIESKTRGYFWGTFDDKWYVVDDKKIHTYESQEELINNWGK